MRALIFDLFGTLVEPFGPQTTLVAEMARALRVDPSELAHEWSLCTEARDAGDFSTISAAIAHCAGRLGRAPDGRQVALATEARHRASREALNRAWPDTFEALDGLRGLGLKLGLVTNCGPDVADFWQGTPLATRFHATVFSAVERVVKPDPRIYRLGCERLGVQPSDCAFVGDGGNGELTGAAQAGLRAIMLAIPGILSAHPAHEAWSWTGERVRALKELPPLFSGQ